MSNNYYKLFPENDENNSSVIGMNGNHGNTGRLFKGNLINIINSLFPKMNLIPSKEDERKPVLDSNFSLFSQTPNELENVLELSRNYSNYIQNPPLHESSSSSCFEKEKTELISSIEFYLTHHEQKILKSINQEKSNVNRSNIVNDCNISLKKNELQNQEVMFPELKSRINSTKFDSELRKTTTMINNISEKKNNLIIENSQLGVESSTSPIDSFKKYEENDSTLETTESTYTASTNNPYSYSYVLKNSLQSTNSSSKSPRMMAMKTNELIFTRSNSRPFNKTNDRNKKKCSTKPKKSTNAATTNCKNIKDNIIKNDDIENNKKSVDCAEHSKFVYRREGNNKHFNQQQYPSFSNYYLNDDDSINKNQKSRNQLNFKRKSFIDCGQIPSVDSERFHNNHQQRKNLHSVIKPISIEQDDGKYKIASNSNKLFDDDERVITFLELEKQAIEQYRGDDSDGDGDENNHFDGGQDKESKSQ